MNFVVSMVASQSTDSAVSRRRLSMSSSEDNIDLEASLMSLGQLQEDSRSHNDGRGSLDSPKRARGNLANIIGLVKSSSASPSSRALDTVWTSMSNYAYDTRALFKRRITNLHNTLTSLKAYVELNYSGFRKILKKYRDLHGLFENVNLTLTDVKCLGMTRLRIAR